MFSFPAKGWTKDLHQNVHLEIRLLSDLLTSGSNCLVQQQLKVAENPLTSNEITLTEYTRTKNDVEGSHGISCIQMVKSRHNEQSVTPWCTVSHASFKDINRIRSTVYKGLRKQFIPNCTQQFLWTLQFNVALPDLVNFMSIASSFETQSPPREGLGAAAKNNSSAVKYAIKRYFFFRDAMMLQRKTWPSQKKNTALSWLNWYLRGLEKNKRPSTRHNCSEKGLLLFYDKLV